MNRFLGAALAVCGLLALAGSRPAWAQAPFGRPPVNPHVGPAISPFLNLFRGGNPAINYYGLVRPQQDFTANLQQFQYQQGQFNQALLTNVDPNAIAITGHPSQFMNFSHYYNYRFANSAAIRPALTPPAVLPPAILPPATLGGQVGVGIQVR
jgi:hypothetical protein